MGVPTQVIHKMTLAMPPKILVENYMIEIAKTYKVPFEPDPVIMMVCVLLLAMIALCVSLIDLFLVMSLTCIFLNYKKSTSFDIKR